VDAYQVNRLIDGQLLSNVLLKKRTTARHEQWFSFFLPIIRIFLGFIIEKVTFAP
jgi:hypothetical protein